MPQIQLHESIQVGDRLTRGQRVLLILKNNPDKRDSYDLIVSEYHRQYKDDYAKPGTLERICRMIQYDIGLYPPTKRTIRNRKKVQQEIIERNKSRKKKTFWGKIKNLFS